MINIDAIKVWMIFWSYRIEDVLTKIFADDGRRYIGDVNEL